MDTLAGEEKHCAQRGASWQGGRRLTPAAVQLAAPEVKGDSAMSAQFTVPQGYGAGDTLRLNVNGSEVTIVLPEGAVEGTVLEFALPPPPAPPPPLPSAGCWRC